MWLETVLLQTYYIKCDKEFSFAASVVCEKQSIENKCLSWTHENTLNVSMSLSGIVLEMGNGNCKKKKKEKKHKREPWKKKNTKMHL